MTASDTTPATPRVYTPHPAKFSDSIMEKIGAVLEDELDYGATILDPFAGVGGVHDFSDRWMTVAVEIEPEWAAQSAERGTTWCGDFFEFEWETSFDAVVTSCTYGNRMADNHQPSPDDTSTRITYRHKLGRQLTANNSGGMQWGGKYRRFHETAWARVHGLLVPGGLFVLNVSDHIRDHEKVPVTAWHRATCKKAGFEVVEDHVVATRRMGFGANGAARVDGEHVIVMRKGDA